MERISGEQFEILTRENPRWAKSLRQPCEVTTPVFLENEHPIEALSPHLIFTGRTQTDYRGIEPGASAVFFRCPNLKHAEGTFHGHVSFFECPLQSLDNLRIENPTGTPCRFIRTELTHVSGDFASPVNFAENPYLASTRGLTVRGVNPEGWAAFFDYCPSLDVAEGTYCGAVSYEMSGVTKTGTLVIQNPCKNGWAATFAGSRIAVACGTFPGYIDFNKSLISRIENLEVTAPNAEGWAASFVHCKNLRHIKGAFHGAIRISHCPVEELNNITTTKPPGAPRHLITHCPNLKELPSQWDPGEFQTDIPTSSLGKQRLAPELGV